MGQSIKASVWICRVVRLRGRDCSGDLVYEPNVVGRSNCFEGWKSAIWDRYLVGAGFGSYSLVVYPIEVARKKEDGLLEKRERYST